MRSIYLDYNATTPLDDEVAEFMIPFLKGKFGNPSSNHVFGIEAKQAMNESRKQVASLLSCKPSEIIFTSGGTESNNLAIHGFAMAARNRGNHIITSTIEHPAVLEVCKSLEKIGFDVSYIGCSKTGKVSISELEKNIRKDTILVSIMHANNETGVIQPVKEISKILNGRNIAFHTDAAQTAGKITVNIKELGVDMLSLASHKFYGPKGTGALYVREGLHLEKVLYGADHEKNLRPGTENIMQIAGMGKAAEVCLRDLAENSARMKETRDRIYQLLHKAFPACTWNGSESDCLPNTLNISFPGLDAGSLLSEIPEIAISAGAACHADSITISHVLKAMDIPDELSTGTLRITTGKTTKTEDVEEAAGIITEKIRNLTGNYHSENYPVDKTEEIKLTRFTHGLGCACKISPRILEEILMNVQFPGNPDILVGTETSDDAAVYKINEELAIVQTLDFFTPIVDDPYQFGEITAVNALSDIYAMGAKPLFGLNIVAFPPHRLPLSVLRQILDGASDVAKEAGIAITGGHTIEDNEPKFGMVISGMVHPERILRNKGAHDKDVIILTKKIGTGILSTALKRNLCSAEEKEQLYRSMRELNKLSSEIISDFPVSSCTDVTGFGLLGHLKEICSASGVSAEINLSKIEFLPGTEDFAAEGIIPGGTENNYSYLKKFVKYDPGMALYHKYIAADAQTSGGLLFTISEKYVENILLKLNAKNINASAIGTIIPENSYTIFCNK